MYWAEGHRTQRIPGSTSLPRVESYGETLISRSFPNNHSLAPILGDCTPTPSELFQVVRQSAAYVIQNVQSVWPIGFVFRDLRIRRDRDAVQLALARLSSN